MTVWRVDKSGRGDLWAHVYGMYQRQELNHIMEFGTVVWSDGHGAVYDQVPVYAPEVAGDDEQEQTACAERQGWTLLTGWTGQYSYHGAHMHPSEFIGGGLADHILTTAGFYVTVAILDDGGFQVTNTRGEVVEMFDTEDEARDALAGYDATHSVEPIEGGGDAWVIAYRLNPYSD